VIGLVYSSRSEESSGVTHLAFHTGGYFTMVDQQGVRTNLFYKDILEVSYQEAPDYGEPCGGTEQDAMRLGQWQSEAFGRYENCTYLNVADCILLKTSTETYAINIESDKSTYALFEAIQKEMAKQ
jgi:hypothetical protein